MLKPEEIEIAEAEARKHCRAIVLPFVTLYAHLPPDEFASKAKAYLERCLTKMMIRTKGEIDELDHMFIDNYWPAIIEEYFRLRSAGASTAGNA